MKKYTFSLLFIFLLAVFESLGQPVKKFIGTWQGTLKAGVELRMVFHVKENGSGGLVTTGDSPDQSAYGLKCDTSFVNGDNLTIEMHALTASFTGRLVNDSTIDGKFKQGVELPLVLYRNPGRNVEKVLPKVQTPTPIGYKSVEVTTQQNGATLSGTCFQPLNDDKSVAVLIIAGSGPTDRDGNSPLLPGKSNTLLQLADSLAHYGIASLRYDKRVIGKSKPPPGTSEADMTLNDIAADAGAMYDWLKTKGYKNLFIIGHSEGSLIGLMIAADKTPNGFISVAGAGRKASDILMEQLAEQFTPPLAAELGKALDSLEQGFTVKKINPSFAGLLRPSVQPYMRSWLKQDPKKLIGQLHCPILILQGTNDLQVKEKDAEQLKSARPNAELVMIKDMNHVLKLVTSGNTDENIKAYSDPSLPLAPLLVRSIVQFMLHAKSR